LSPSRGIRVAGLNYSLSELSVHTVYCRLKHDSFSLGPWRFISGPLGESWHPRSPVCETSDSDLRVLAHRAVVLPPENEWR
jgi:hypothetical protein